VVCAVRSGPVRARCRVVALDANRCGERRAHCGAVSLVAVRICLASRRALHERRRDQLLCQHTLAGRERLRCIACRFCHKGERGYKSVAFAARAVRNLQSAGGSPRALADDHETARVCRHGAVATQRSTDPMRQGSGRQCTDSAMNATSSAGRDGSGVLNRREQRSSAPRAALQRCRDHANPRGHPQPSSTLPA
jgi:hypothetical protein